jgi:imidazolonepropionase
MNKILLNIGQLVGVSDSDYRFSAGANMQKLNILNDAYLTFEDGLITGFGLMSERPDLQKFSEVFDAKNQMVFPSFVDSHTHLVYAGSREIE